MRDHSSPPEGGGPPPSLTYALPANDSVCQPGTLPIVQFSSLPHPVTVGPERWTVTDEWGNMARRTQVPLKLAWALTVHKCQGMTVDRVRTDLSQAFGCGMVYVALSRVRALEGLFIEGFDRNRVRVSANGPALGWAECQKGNAVLIKQVKQALLQSGLGCWQSRAGKVLHVEMFQMCLQVLRVISWTWDMGCFVLEDCFTCSWLFRWLALFSCRLTTKS